MKQYSRELLLKFFENMYLVRHFEEQTALLYQKGYVAGFCHLYIGEEAIVTGVYENVSQSDSVISSYREHGHILLAGVEPKYVMAELTGRIDGVSKGKGGSMHMFSKENNFFGGHGIVGACVPIGTGIAFSHKYKEDGGVCFCFIGDGAINQGQVYESFNMASLWKLPIIYIIENNHYALGTSLNRSHSMTELYKKGIGFNIPGSYADGMNVISVYEEVKKAVTYVKEGNGPIIIEFDTYRYRGHSMSDPAKYRTREEVDSVRSSRDPISIISTLLTDKYSVTEDELEGIMRRVNANISEACEFAIASPEPSASDLYDDLILTEGV